jgi:ankyrin repeat protein
LEGHIPVVQFLIESGALVNIGSVSPLHTACHHSRYEIVKMLIKANADLSLIAGEAKETALHVAIRKGKDDKIIRLIFVFFR